MEFLIIAVDAMAGASLTHPDLLPLAKRLLEVCAVLAAGLLRLRAGARQSSEVSGDQGESCLDFLPTQRGHADPTRGRGA